MTSTCEVVTRQAGDAVVLELAGEIDSSAADVLSRAYDEAAAGRPTASSVTALARIILDFTAVDYINSSGIAVIVSVLAKARAQGHQVVAAGLTEHYRQIFLITRLSDFIDIQPDIGSAVGASGAAAVTGVNHA